MLFFKPKRKSDELLPPPTPFPVMELEEEKEKPKFFDEIIKPKKAKAETFPEEEEFSDLLQELNEELKPKREKNAKKAVIKKQIPKTLKKIKQIKKEKKAPLIKIKTKKVAKPKAELPELEEDFLKDLDIELPKELEPKKEIVPETLEDFGMEDNFGKYEQEKTKPKEIIEAEEEIKSAIEKIKEREKPSFFKGLFAKSKQEDKQKEEHLIQELPEADDISSIQSNINKAREALMKFDLETAKKNYIEILKLYNKIKPEEQAKVYQDIRDLYFERKSAEELKV